MYRSKAPISDPGGNFPQPPSCCFFACPVPDMLPFALVSLEMFDEEEELGRSTQGWD